MLNKTTAHALTWLRLVARQGYIAEENREHIIKMHGGGNAEHPHILPPPVFEYLLQEGFITPEGPEGEPHRSFFITKKGRGSCRRRTMTRYLLTLATLCLLVGCVSPPTYIRPPGASQQDFAAAQAYCNAQAQPFMTGGFMGAASFIQQKDMCMAGKGYNRATPEQIQQQTEAPAR